MKKFIRAIAQKLGVEIGRDSRDPLERAFVSLSPKSPSRGNVLLSYEILPFLGEDVRLALKEADPERYRRETHHTEPWECTQMARTFLDLGYQVDVISKHNEEFVPRKDYSFFIDVSTNMERIGPLLNDDCVKILHIAWAHWLFHNSAESQRCLALQRRKGVSVRPRRQRKPNLAIEHAECATTLGNEFTISTYAYAQKPIFCVPNTTIAVYPSPRDKDFDVCRNHFLWLGGRGLVHKGLDLVLDAFMELPPEYHLTICGAIDEEDFTRAYHEELYETPNIHTTGWIDVESREFLEIANKCIGLVYPSCSESGCGGVMVCMHAGLIPIVSYETSVDVKDFGAILKESSVGEIQDSVRRLSRLPTKELEAMAWRTWEHARAHHTREKFAQEYEKVIRKIVILFGKRSEAQRARGTLLPKGI